MKGAPNRTVRPDKQGRFPCLVADENYWEGDVALGNGTQWRFCLLDFEGELVVAIRGKGVRKWTKPAMPERVKKGYGMMEGDAGNVADFINCQMERRLGPFGFYREGSCANGDDT